MGVQKKGCLYFEQCHYPLETFEFSSGNFEDIEESFENCMWMSAVHPGAHLLLNEDALAELARRARVLREQTDRAIVGLFGGSIFEVPQYLFKNEKYLMYMALYPDAIHELS